MAWILPSFPTLGARLRLSPRLMPGAAQVAERSQRPTPKLVSRYPMCYRVDALRAVEHDTSPLYDPTAPFCPEYDE